MGGGIDLPHLLILNYFWVLPPTMQDKRRSLGVVDYRN